MATKTVNDGKTIAIISYITVIGLLIAFIMNSSKRNSFASFHIRQMLGISILGFINWYIVKAYINSWVASIIGLFLLVLLILGLISAIQGEKKSVPFIGDYFQDWFKGI